MSKNVKPDGELMIRTLAMPAQTNPNGDIFGGWVVSQMDLAGGSLAFRVAQARVVTAAIDSMSFLAPVKVGDAVCCYAKLVGVGNTSMQIQIQVWVERAHGQIRSQVTEGLFTFVAIDESGRPMLVKKG